MISIAKQTCQAPETQENQRFIEMLPLIRRRARLAFRRVRSDIKDDLVQEVLANAFCHFSRLVRAGKADLAFATPLANFAIRQVIAGRRVGNKPDLHDVFSFAAQRRHGFSLQTLRSDGSYIWSEILADDTLTPIADQVAFRLDFPAWLKTQSRSKRELAKFLAIGNSTTQAASRFGVSAPRISQLRSELHASWREFQGEVAQTASRMPSGSKTGVA